MPRLPAASRWRDARDLLGLSDADSWPNSGRMNYSLLWDRHRQPKPVFNVVVDALRSAK
jgi:Glycosyl hydrolase family 10